MFDGFGNAQQDGNLHAVMAGTSGAALGREIPVVQSKDGNVITFGYIIYKPTGSYNLELHLEGDDIAHDDHDHGALMVIVMILVLILVLMMMMMMMMTIRILSFI